MPLVASANSQPPRMCRESFDSISSLGGVVRLFPNSSGRLGLSVHHGPVLVLGERAAQFHECRMSHLTPVTGYTFPQRKRAGPYWSYRWYDDSGFRRGTG